MWDSHQPSIKERIKLAEKLKRKPETPLKLVPPHKGPARPSWMTRVYKNNRYIVMIDDHKKTTHGEAICAMIQAVDAKPIPNHWAEIQRIKNAIFGKEAMGIEYYPPQSKLTDDANIYWLWVFPAGIIPEKL
jgi:hypothetical protein